MDPSEHITTSADRNFRNTARGEFGQEHGRGMASFAIGFTYLDLGKDVVTGEEINRLILAGCIIGPEVTDQILRNGRKVGNLIEGTGNVKVYDIVTYKPKNAPLENHHGIMYVWAKNNIPGYKSRASKSTTIALTKEQHNATKAVYRDWLFDRTGKKVGGKVDWTKVSPQEIQKLSEDMFDAANVPQSARKEYYKEFNKYIYQLP
ncbi:hypothetical protein [Vallitalea sp.]|jgi:hypothetical protein|uniref:hypothetical protein n=1 Tax=Vallitalea sp. TaxID=1882829 RepID=UPI0025E45732|nr:hypothetical protein [Vallitalea sp.]MCT4688501.1 hypothetical protein [Vallitalea sp.]